jgi:hypothetical protein
MTIRKDFLTMLHRDADRFKIFAQLEKIPLDSTDVQNFVQLLEINNGILVSITNTPQYNILSQEFARSS